MSASVLSACVNPINSYLVHQSNCSFYATVTKISCIFKNAEYPTFLLLFKYKKKKFAHINVETKNWSSLSTYMSDILNKSRLLHMAIVNLRTFDYFSKNSSSSITCNKTVYCYDTVVNFNTCFPVKYSF